MSPKQFRVLIDTLGTDMAKWPPDQRAAAKALLASSSEAQEIFAEGLDVERLLNVPEPPLSDDQRNTLIDKIMNNLDDSEA